MQIKAKPYLIKQDPISNKAVVYVFFVDEQGHKWEKNYPYNVTETIDPAKFKDRVAKDIQKDLKTKDYLKEVNKLVGKEFSIII